MLTINLNNLIKALALGIFIYQMHQSLDKYLNSPMIHEFSETHIDNIMVPKIYVCNVDQFNYTAANSHGYLYNTYYVVGKIENSSVITWQGNNSLSVDEVSLDVYQVNYTSFSTRNTSKKSKVFLQPDGHCFELTDFSFETYMKIRSTQTTKVYMIDPRKSLNMSLITTDPGVDNIWIQPTTSSPTTFEGKTFDITVEMIDNKIMDGITCTNYDLTDMDFNGCIMEMCRSEFLKLIGCLPPWFPSSNEVKCNYTIPGRVVQLYAYVL